jgi:3-dehydroquinate synthetase
MSKVFVIHQPAVKDRFTGRMRPQHDLSPALRFGEIVDVLPPGSISQDIRNLKTQIMERLLDEGCCRDDYLLAIGDPVAIVIGAFAMAAFSDRIRLLKWDRRMRGYVVSEINWDVGEFMPLVEDSLK